jgi:hypothetical protein
VRRGARDHAQRGGHERRHVPFGQFGPVVGQLVAQRVYRRVEPFRQPRLLLGGQVAAHPLSRPEQVKSYRVLDRGWGPESGELTPTLKLRRRVIEQRYADVIEELYAGGR